MISLIILIFSAFDYPYYINFIHFFLFSWGHSNRMSLNASLLNLEFECSCDILFAVISLFVSSQVFRSQFQTIFNYWLSQNLLQKFDIWPVFVRVDYTPSRVDLAALRGGKYVELVNLVPWKVIYSFLILPLHRLVKVQPDACQEL